jgi:glutathione peroxidase-family protein
MCTSGIDLQNLFTFFSNINIHGMTILHMAINMSEQEPQDTTEWEAFADKKYSDIKKTLKDIESKGSSQPLEHNIRDVTKSFGDMLTSLGALAYGITSDVVEKTSSEEREAFQEDMGKKASSARNIIADELDKVSSALRSEADVSEENKETPDTSET